MKKTIALLLLSLPAAATYAQTPVQALDQNVSAVGSPSLQNPVSSSNGVQVSGQNGSSNVSVKISGSISSTPGSNLPLDAKRGHLSADGDYRIWSVTAQAPLATGGSSATLATLDGLSNATTIEFKFSNASLTGMNYDTKLAADYCDNKIEPKFKLDPKNKSEDFVCDLGNAQKYLSRADYAEFHKAYYQENWKYSIWGFSAKAGYKDFTYYDAATRAKESTREGPASLGAFYSMYPDNGKTLLTASLQFQKAYKDATTGTLCPTSFPPSGLLQCVAGPVGAPTSKTTEILSLEVRRRVFRSVGASLNISRDFQNRISGISVPIYFIPDTTGGITGGLSLGWTSDTHKGTIGLFVGQAFSLFN